MAISTAASIPAAGPTTGTVRSAREVVPAALWNKQVGLLMRDYPYDSVMAARVLGQGYAYLLTAMKHRGGKLGLAPSSLVDIGVHTIILDTVAYAELCDRFNGGHFLHHVPEVDFKNDGSVMKTAHRVAADGWEVDLSLWEDAAKCSPCHPGSDSH
ncbi:hypothetical protein [Streptomyces sp. SLBN-134]|uniref:hypothetical protein n=1 Tax=Streptomyces sp. SLBN-134 TaxID=2768456 RepID=UPI00116EB5B5|nr:hypothetical protein [Streptomyces sp. SLBN-134]TQL21019.1 hypothetical protein FBY37_2988 [Streptomyces sp. SLBN-134]